MVKMDNIIFQDLALPWVKHIGILRGPLALECNLVTNLRTLGSALAVAVKKSRLIKHKPFMADVYPAYFELVCGSSMRHNLPNSSCDKSIRWNVN